MDRDLVRCRGCHKTWVAEGGNEVCFDCQSKGVSVNLRNARTVDVLQKAQVFQSGGRFHRMVGNSNKE